MGDIRRFIDPQEMDLTLPKNRNIKVYGLYRWLETEPLWVLEEAYEYSGAGSDSTRLPHTLS